MATTDPDRADEIHQALAELPGRLRTVMAAIYDYPPTVPILTGTSLGDIYPAHLAAAVLTGRVDPDDLLGHLDCCNRLSPTITGGPA